MKILALDLGKFKTVGCVFDSISHEAQYMTFKTTPMDMHHVISGQRPDRVVFEVGPAAGWVYDIAVANCTDVQVANPSTEGWRWRNVKAKTDRLDALKLAKLSAADQLPQVHMASPQVRQRRGLIGYRQALVARRTAIKNRIRSILHGQGLSMPAGKSGWTEKSLLALSGMAWPSEQVSAKELWRYELYEELDALGEIDKRMERVEKRLNSLNRGDGRVALLRTIGGVGPRTAEVLVTVIDDPHRFHHANQLGSYAGLVPRQYDSGQMQRQGRITKQGNALMRQVLVQAAWQSLRRNERLREVFDRICKGSVKRRKIAIIAVARRVLVIAWAMLRDNKPWQRAQAAAA